MAQPQYFEVLKQDDKNTGQQQFFTNVEDQTVQYVITPNKTQVQYPTTPIVVASGEQLMVVNGPPQQIVIDQSSITYQEPEVQQQLQLPRQQMKPTLRISNQNQPVRQITSGIVQQRPQLPPPLQTVTSQPQVKPSNHLQRTNSPIQLNLRQHLPMSRSIGTSIQQMNSPKPQTIQQQLRQVNTNQQLRHPVPGQQIRLSTMTAQQRPNLLKNAAMANARFQGPQIQQPQQQVQGTSSLVGDVEAADMKSNDQEAVTLADGSIVPVGAYKKMLGEQKARTVTQKAHSNQTTQQNAQQSPTVSSVTQPSPTKKKNTTPRNPRQPPRGGARGTGKGRNQVQGPKASAQSLQSKDSPQFPVVNQQQQTKQHPYQSPLQSVPQNQLAPQHEQLQQQVQQQMQQQQQLQQQQQQVQQQQQMQQQQIQQQQLQQQLQQQMQQQIQQQQLLQQLARPSQANYVIQPPKPNQKPQPQRPLPAYIPSSQIQKIIESTPIGEEFSDSIRMLVLLENGEQRLITFTLPKEACTIQEILEQVNVPFQSNTNIQVTEANSNGINYIVTVGNVPPLGYEEEESHTPAQEQSQLNATIHTTDQHPSQPQQQQLQQQQLQQQQLQQQQQQQQLATTCPLVVGQPPAETPSSPEPAKEIRKLVPGMLALCGACGYLSEDFIRCIRCLRKLPDNVKSIQAPLGGANGQKKQLQVGHQAQPLHILQNQQQPQPQLLQQPLHQQPILQQQQAKNGPVSQKPTSPTKKKTKSNKSTEQESVVISSDDEEDDEKPSGLSENILQKLGNSVTISPITKEPSSNDIQRHLVSRAAVSANNVVQEKPEIYKTKLKCRTVRIGSYRCVPTEEISIDSLQVIIKVPHPKDKEIKTIKVEKSDIVKILASFNSSLPVLFYYVSLNAAEKIRAELDMTSESDYYFDPLSTEDEAQRRITLLPDDIEENDRNMFQLIYPSSSNILDELNVKEANDILIKTCPKELTKNAIGFTTFTEIQKLVTYPPEGRGRISINTEDYLCLGQDQFLNDVIIDFYLKYLVDHLPSEQKRKIHIFSTFFYKRLTTKPVKASRKSQPAELDPTLSSAQKRHARVKTWTKNVNLFEKDFVVVPINENAHWFLAIICFPGLDGCQTWDGKPYKLEVKSRSKKKVAIATIGTVSVTPVKQEKVAKPIVCEDPEISDKDEAEGDDSEMESDDSEELPLSQNSQNLATNIPALTIAPIPKTPKEPRPPIQQPCILIFDSLAGASRSRVVATLRDYLTCEHKAKLGKERIYDKNVIKGANPKVPQQNNFTDCGLYVLQYVEQFFKDPIKDYHIPIKEIKNWFEELTVTKKREDIAILIKSLMRENGKDTRMLPEISFPTFNGKLVECEPDEDDEDEMMEEESFGEEDMKDDSMTTLDSTKSDLLSEAVPSAEDPSSPLKPSNDSTSDDFTTQTVLNPKPDLSEFPRQTNKDTLSYLKAKRINRHKAMDGPEMKKHKSDEQ